MDAEPPRILVLADKMAAGGTERQVLGLLAGLRRNGRYGVAFARLDHDAAWDADACALAEVVLPVRRRARYDVTPAWALVRQARAASIRLVHTYGWMAGLAGLFGARTLEIPIVNGGIRATPPTLRVRDRVSRWCAARSDAIVANSIAGLAAFGLETHPKAQVIPNGIDLRRFEGVVPEVFPGPAVCMVANFSRLKDHVTPLRALPHILAAIPDVTFVFVGNDGGTLAASRQLAVELGVERAVRMVTGVLHPEPYVAGSQACVLTSPEGEGLSNAVLEYMAMGKPVVATDCGGNRAAIRDGETGFLVPGEAAEVVAARVVELLRDTARARRMGEAGRQVVDERFSLDAMVARYEALYDRLLTRPGREAT